MNNISVQADKKIKAGFILVESDVRRLAQLSQEQILKSGTQKSYHLYALKFQNGTIAETGNLDEVFMEDNTGSNKIIMLNMLTSSVEIPKEEKTFEANEPFIQITFNDLSSDNNSNPNPIRYKIGGSSRDWVMVTSSLIEERLLKFKRKNFTTASKYFLSFILLSMLAVFIIVLPNLDSSKDQLKALEFIETQNKLGKYSTPNELILILEKTRIERSKSSIPPKVLVVPLILMLIYVISTFKFSFLGKFYPMYNFCWGDYNEEFKKIEKRRKFIIGIIVITIIMGIIINLLSNIIWQKIG